MHNRSQCALLGKCAKCGPKGSGTRHWLRVPSRRSSFQQPAAANWKHGAMLNGPCKGGGVTLGQRRAHKCRPESEVQTAMQSGPPPRLELFAWQPTVGQSSGVESSRVDGWKYAICAARAPVARRHGLAFTWGAFPTTAGTASRAAELPEDTLHTLAGRPKCRSCTRAKRPPGRPGLRNASFALHSPPRRQPPPTPTTWTCSSHVATSFGPSAAKDWPQTGHRLASSRRRARPPVLPARRRN